MKTFKGFVKQRAQLEVSMAEGWMVQESCVFVSEYLSHSQNNVLELWSTKDDDRVLGDVLQGNGIVKQFSEKVRSKVNNYCMMNSDRMQRWYEMYEKQGKNRSTLKKNGTRKIGVLLIQNHYNFFQKL